LRKRRILFAGGVVLLAIVFVIGALFVFTGKTTAVPTTLDSQANAGKTIFLKSCNGCHGSEGRSGNIFIPPLSTSKLSDEAIRTIITQGKAPAMPSFKDYTAQDLDNLLAYIKAIKSAAG
jgi:mono/diheme cytochrome c family protein